MDEYSDFNDALKWDSPDQINDILDKLKNAKRKKNNR